MTTDVAGPRVFLLGPKPDKAAALGESQHLKPEDLVLVQIGSTTLFVAASVVAALLNAANEDGVLEEPGQIRKLGAGLLAIISRMSSDTIQTGQPEAPMVSARELRVAAMDGES